jgi:hypothetical protein
VVWSCAVSVWCVLWAMALISIPVRCAPLLGLRTATTAYPPEVFHRGLFDANLLVKGCSSARPRSADALHDDPAISRGVAGRAADADEGGEAGPVQSP